MCMRQTCHYCMRESLTVKTRRRNTAYVNDEDNFVTCCVLCWMEQEKDWEAMWDEYWRGRL